MKRITKTRITQIILLLDSMIEERRSYEIGLPTWDENWMEEARQRVYDLLNDEEKL
ncbi:MAG: protein of unknown function DUF3580 [Myoviridae sp. ctThM1]|nr:MAG: protein of unknown function DUF3580 [Myoviridae sp. ctThM1]